MAPVLRPRDHGYGTRWSLIGLDSWVSGGDPVARRARARENISTIQEALARAACKRRGQRLACEEAMADQLEMREAVVASGGKMPEPRLLDLPLLPTGQGERFYLERCMRVFGEDWNGTAIVEAPSGHQLAVSSLLFSDHKKGRSKVDKRGRAPYVLYIARTILQPDEIRLDSGDFGDRRLYFLAPYRIAGHLVGILAAFVENKRIWEGWSAYQIPLPARDVYFETKRDGDLVFFRADKT